MNFSISAAIGFISLFGVSVMSGILIISGYHRVATAGMTVIVGGMLIGPVMLLVIVPALQSYFLGHESAPAPRLPQGESEQM